ncbi:unnamed protein product [Polarella glacialis]|uniref:Uncharacterized protein n=1 Tax=Polarella glacialis TaxID=89957 RepID=A0A813JI51_POLGL|nr:unnamed protein product [Polarella glacialis]
MWCSGMCVAGSSSPRTCELLSKGVKPQERSSTKLVLNKKEGSVMWKPVILLPAGRLDATCRPHRKLAEANTLLTEFHLEAKFARSCVPTCAARQLSFNVSLTKLIETHLSILTWNYSQPAATRVKTGALQAPPIRRRRSSTATGLQESKTKQQQQ